MQVHPHYQEIAARWVHLIVAFFFFCCCYTYCTNDYRRDHRHHFRLHLHHRTCYFHYFNVHFLSFFIMPLIKRPCNSPPIATALLPHVVTRSPPCSILRHDPACVAEADRSVNCSSAATATARFTAQTPFTSLFRPTSPLPLPLSMTTTSRLPLLQGALSPEGLGAGRCPAAKQPTEPRYRVGAAGRWHARAVRARRAPRHRAAARGWQTPLGRRIPAWLQPDGGHRARALSP